MEIPNVGAGRIARWLLVVFLVVTAWSSFTTVSAGYRGVVLKFGATTGRVLNPGAHFILPFVESVRSIPTQIMKMSVIEEAASHDLQVIKVEVTLTWYNEPSDAAMLYIWNRFQDNAGFLEVNPAMLEAIKAQTAQYDAQDLISKRPQVRDGIDNFLRERLKPHYCGVDSVSITQLDFSQQYNQAIEEKVTAMQKVSTAQNNLQRIQVEAQQQIAQAEGQAKAQQLLQQSITPGILNKMAIEKWDGHLPTYMGGNGAVPFVPISK
jgi:regulator of protease activity HflC (stomatin/prohibitin superfamily)